MAACKKKSVLDVLYIIASLKEVKVFDVSRGKKYKHDDDTGRICCSIERNSRKDLPWLLVTVLRHPKKEVQKIHVLVTDLEAGKNAILSALKNANIPIYSTF